MEENAHTALGTYNMDAKEELVNVSSAESRNVEPRRSMNNARRGLQFRIPVLGPLIHVIDETTRMQSAHPKIS